MDRLTTSQIDDFNNPLAFARSRTTRIGQNVIGMRENRTIRTADIEESFRLVSGAEQRLETLEGNLNTMLGLARDGQRVRGNQRSLREIYGKLRSLSAGFDQVVQAIRFSGRQVFTGNQLVLNLGAGAQPLTLDASKLLTYGEDSLALSKEQPMAEVSIGYRTEDLIVNSAYDLIGLDIDSADFSADANPALELEDGEYKVQISYAGDNSTVAIRSREGALIEARDGVDLSGSGRTWVDFDSGIRLTFRKEQFLESIDKYDFENNGPAELTATMTYRRLDGHVLRTGEAPPPDGASFIFNGELNMGNGSLRVTDPKLSPIDPAKQGLESGNYNLQIEYRGENSVIRLTDGLGRLRAFKFGADLTAQGRQQIDLGVGLSFELDNQSFSGDGAILNVPVQYERARPAIEDFDFRQYSKEIEQAIEVVAEQRELIAKAKADIEENNRLRNSAATAGLPNAGAFFASGALSILSGGGDNSLFKPASAGARLNTLSTQLFSITTALPTQANITPQQLSSTQMAAAGGWLGTFA